MTSVTLHNSVSQAYFNFLIRYQGGGGWGYTNSTYLGGLLRVLMKSHMQFTWNTGGAQNVHFTSLMANFPSAWASAV